MTVWHEEDLATLHLGDCLKVLAEMEPDSADLIVTSPPYFALRSYTDGGEHYDGQIGSEATPQEFLEALWAVTRECVRVLKPSGSLWVNLGDKMSRGDRTTVDGTTDKRSQGDSRVPPCRDIPAKSLMLLPQRYAIGCIDQLGLICRAEVIWSKPNGLPESVTDRVRRSHEQWFMFTKEPRYFSAVDEIRESRSGDVVEAPPQHLPGCPLFVGPSDPLRSGLVGGGHEGVPGIQLFDLPDEVGADQGVKVQASAGADQEGEARLLPSVPLAVEGDAIVAKDGGDLLDDPRRAVVDHQPEVRRTVAAVTERHRSLSVDDSGEPRKVCTCGHATYHTGLGKLPGSVWEVPTEPLRVPDHLGVDHFAAFPSEWPRRIILGWSPSGVCEACGEGRRPVVAKERYARRPCGVQRIGTSYDHAAPAGTKHDIGHVLSNATITGYACACPDTTAPTRPAVVLDPFAGTGTTVAVAKALGRHGVGIDMSEDYLRLARWRIDNIDLAVKVAERSGMAAPAGEHDGMVVNTLFEEA